jgi:hypothetical protein
MKWHTLQEQKPRDGQHCIFELHNGSAPTFMSGQFYDNKDSDYISLVGYRHGGYSFRFNNELIKKWCDLKEFVDSMEMPDPVIAERGAVKVNLPGPDLFSMLEEAERQAEEPQHEAEPVQRKYTRNGRRMEEHAAVEAAQKIGRAQGFSSRTDIERSIVRVTGRTREDVRDAVNRVARELHLVCIKSNGYRYYRCEQRGEIINKACAYLEAV